MEDKHLLTTKFSHHMYNMTDETFFNILFKGFYYIRDSKIFWEQNAVFVGNGYSGSMVTTFPVSNGDTLIDAHAWDWTRSETIFDFKDYGRTWSCNREELENILKHQGEHVNG